MAKMQRTSWPATKGAAVPSDFFPWECEQRDPPGSGQVVMSGSTCELKLSGADSGSSLGKPGGEVGARSDEQAGEQVGHEERQGTPQTREHEQSSWFPLVSPFKCL